MADLARPPKTSPGDFFDIPPGPLAGFFDGVSHVWEGVAALPDFVESIIEPRVEGQVEEGAWLEPGAVQLEEGCRVERGAVVRGPAIIGRGTVIRTGAYIRGHVMLGESCVIGHGVELRQMLALTGTTVPHHSCVFTSLFGNRVWFAGSAQTANHLLSHEEVVVRIRYEGRTHEFPTGQSLLGAVIGDDTSVGALSLVHPGTLIGRRCVVLPQSSVSGYIPDDTRVRPRRFAVVGPESRGQIS